jgi:magnesium-transporting ATPase (P-type)
LTATINEELGSIEYILSDKTGTLTKNQMELRAFCVADKIFGGSFVNSKIRSTNNNFPNEQSVFSTAMTPKKNRSLISQNKDTNFNLEDYENDFDSELVFLSKFGKGSMLPRRMTLRGENDPGDLEKIQEVNSEQESELRKDKNSLEEIELEDEQIARLNAENRRNSKPTIFTFNPDHKPLTNSTKYPNSAAKHMELKSKRLKSNSELEGELHSLTPVARYDKRLPSESQLSDLEDHIQKSFDKDETEMMFKKNFKAGEALPNQVYPSPKFMKTWGLTTPDTTGETGETETLEDALGIDDGKDIVYSTYYELVNEFLECAALAHEVLVENDEEEPGKKKYQSSSPDEVAICERLRDVDIEFQGLNLGTAQVKFHKKVQKFEQKMVRKTSIFPL